jgi:hypothetical protein
LSWYDNVAMRDDGVDNNKGGKRVTFNKNDEGNPGRKDYGNSDCVIYISHNEENTRRTRKITVVMMSTATTR